MFRFITYTFLVFFTATSYSSAQTAMTCANTNNQCGGTYLDPGGAANYADNANCTQTICPPVGQCVTLQFTSVNLEDGYDFLEVYNGSVVAGTPLAIITGTSSPGNVTSTTGCLTLVFTSDFSTTSTGWLANVICHPCGSPPPPPPGPIVASDCSGAVNICTDASFQIDPAGSGGVVEFTNGFGSSVSNPLINPASSNDGCMNSGELNSTWMIINIATTGTLEFSFGANGGINCLDWIMWPYTSATCSGIINNTLAPVRCNYNFPCEAFTGVASPLPIGGEAGNFEPELLVTCGQRFIICLSNFSSASTSLPLNFFGTATISCSTFTPITVNSPTICPSQSATLTATGGNTYSWSPATGLSATSGATVTATPAATTIYTVTGTGSCGSGTATSTVTVLAAGDPLCITPTCSATATNTGPYCPGTTIQLNSTGGGNYSWTGPNGFTSTVQNPSIPSGTAAASGMYIVTINVSGCTATATTTVVVNPLPTPTASNTGPYCEGATIQLNSTGSGTYSWSGPNSFTSTSQNPTISSAVAANAGIYTVTVTAANGCTATATTTVVVNPLPTPTASNTGPYCLGAAINLSSSGGGTYSWSGPNSFTSTSQNPNIPNAAAVHAGIYTVTVTSVGCSATATTSVAVVSAASTSASNTGPYCAGTTIALNCSAGTSYNWSGPNSFTSTLQSPSITSSVVANAGIYTVTVTSAGCSASATTTVVVNALPAPAASNTGPYCAGAAITLNSSGGATYSWSGPNSFTSTLQSPSITSSVVANAGIYTVTVTAANGCTATATTTVVVNPLPTPTASNTGPYCVGAAINLSSSGVGTYSWSGPNAYTSTSQNPSIPNAVVVNAGTYTVTVTDANSCSASSTTIVVVNALPTPAASNTGPYCVGAAINLSSSGGGTYSWTGPNTYTSTLQNPTITSAAAVHAGIYTVTVTSAGCSASATATVVVNPNPIPTASNTGPYCEGAAINLSSSGGGTYSWSGPNAYTSTSQNPSIPNSVAVNAGIYTVTVTDANSCSASSTTTVVANPIPTVFAGNDVTICNGQTATLTGDGASTYTWNNGVSNGVAFTPTSDGTYTVTGTSAGCTATDQVSITVETAPNVAFAPDVAFGCSPLIVNFTNSSTNSANCVWQMGTGATETGCGTVSHTFTQAGCYDITLSVTSAGGCVSSLTAADMICVEASPTASFSPSNSMLTQFDTYVHFENNSSNATTYWWDFGDSSPTSIEENPQHDYVGMDIGTYVVTLIATSPSGCADTAQSVIKIYEELIFYVPNTFTPDNDDYNQTFQPIFTSGFDPLAFNMKIYNRWGELVFETNDAELGWDGSYGANGEVTMVQEGVYTWKIEFKLSKNDEHRMVKGHLNILR